ncbi:uncharacterized protein LOC120422976 isoform X2 [Culex pipiens pallens]|uniref:uncharacterized protein LOC120422976 isoform X2 n=1 Tax=Culex pipiens pallens TaxID=42434 RepID=UPI001953C6CC|nr:uncharacterized protein LOC120422976 isoform X2 [Culex pipiens pallens]
MGRNSRNSSLFFKCKNVPYSSRPRHRVQNAPSGQNDTRDVSSMRAALNEEVSRHPHAAGVNLIGVPSSLRMEQSSPTTEHPLPHHDSATEINSIGAHGESIVDPGVLTTCEETQQVPMEEDNEQAITTKTWEDLGNGNRSETFLFDLSDTELMDEDSDVDLSEDESSTLNDSQSFEESFDDEEADEIPAKKDEEPLHPSLPLSKQDVLQLVLIYFMRHKLTNVALCDLLAMINVIIGKKSLPENYETFSNYFSFDKYQRQFICSSCGLYTGEEKGVCTNCSGTKFSFFVVFDIAANIANILKRNWSSIVEHKQKSKSSPVVTDIVNAAMYKHKTSKHNITLSMNTDGVKVFNSSKRSLWPVMFQVNDLPPKVKFLRKNIVVAALWLGDHEPPMDAYLKPVMEILNTLFTGGLDIGIVKIDKIEVTACLADTLGRCKIQNFKQFNGYEACGFCYHPGDLNGRQVRYGYRTTVVKRNHYDTLKAMTTSAATNQSIKGVKGISPLIYLPNFDLIRGCPIDFMHCVLLGVCKQLCKIWFETPRSTCYVKSKISSIDSFLMTILDFNESSRRPRKISDRASWKANEWLHWLIHYSVVPLKFILPSPFYKHFLLLVRTISDLLQNSISEETFNICEQRMQKFVESFENLYGLQEMLYNVHLLTHIVDCSKDHGPLWAFSLLPFEDMNGVFKKFIKGPKEPLIQISNRCSIQSYVHNSLIESSPSTIDYLTKLNSIKYCESKKTDYTFNLDISIPNLYSSNRQFTVFSRLKFLNFLYKPMNYDSNDQKHSNKSNNDCYFSVEEDGEFIFGAIQKILSDANGFYFLISPLEIKAVNDLLLEAQFVKQKNVLVKINDTLTKYLLLEFKGRMFLRKLMYTLHVD